MVLRQTVAQSGGLQWDDHTETGAERFDFKLEARVHLVSGS